MLWGVLELLCSLDHHIFACFEETVILRLVLIAHADPKFGHELVLGVEDLDRRFQELLTAI